MANTQFEIAPYFDVLLQRLDDGDARMRTAFGRHVHWGYWPDPAQADGSPEDYAVAAERLCQRLCDAAGIRDGMRVLDVGCGIGGTLASLNERFTHLDMVGVNLDARQLERAEELVKPGNGNRVRFVWADACRLPFERRAFDAVLAVECIFHFGSRSAFLQGAARSLVPGGRMAVSDFVPSPELLGMVKDVKLGHDEATRASYGIVDFDCTLVEYRKLATSAGLAVVGCEDVTAETMPTYAFLRGDQQEWHDRAASRAYEKATNRLEMACRMGFVAYSIVSFARKAGCAELAA